MLRAWNRRIENTVSDYYFAGEMFDECEMDQHLRLFDSASVLLDDSAECRGEIPEYLKRTLIPSARILDEELVDGFVEQRMSATSVRDSLHFMPDKRWVISHESESVCTKLGAGDSPLSMPRCCRSIDVGQSVLATRTDAIPMTVEEWRNLVDLIAGRET
jgi:hypothetical protein